ncbi:MAG: hypothetical protein LBR79_02240 [Oscillospiraceae bacterium]|jgi:hypothetical protein|nr:hypothetical protein [Oscillospiraceae bacterium]
MKKNKSKIFTCCALLFINSFVVSKVSAGKDTPAFTKACNEAIAMGYTPEDAKEYADAYIGAMKWGWRPEKAKKYAGEYAYLIRDNYSPYKASVYASCAVESGRSYVQAEYVDERASARTKAYNRAIGMGYTPDEANIYADEYTARMYSGHCCNSERADIYANMKIIGCSQEAIEEYIKVYDERRWARDSSLWANAHAYARIVLGYAPEQEDRFAGICITMVFRDGYGMITAYREARGIVDRNEEFDIKWQ